MKEQAVKPAGTRPAAQASTRAKVVSTKEADASPAARSSVPFSYPAGNIPFYPPAQRVEAPAASVEAPPERAPDRPDGLPPALRRGVESLSGIPVHDVKVRRDSAEPAKIGALAYAKGPEIHLGPGQERHLPHEAWHVVQQRQGRVKPTIQAKGVPVNDDAGLEAEADAMGAKAQGGPSIQANRALHLGPVRRDDVAQRASKSVMPKPGNDGTRKSGRTVRTPLEAKIISTEKEIESLKYDLSQAVDKSKESGTPKKVYAQKIENRTRAIKEKRKELRKLQDAQKESEDSSSEEGSDHEDSLDIDSSFEDSFDSHDGADDGRKKEFEEIIKNLKKNFLKKNEASLAKEHKALSTNKKRLKAEMERLEVQAKSTGDWAAATEELQLAEHIITGQDAPPPLPDPRVSALSLAYDAIDRARSYREIYTKDAEKEDDAEKKKDLDKKVDDLQAEIKKITDLLDKWNLDDFSKEIIGLPYDPKSRHIQPLFKGRFELFANRLHRNKADALYEAIHPFAARITELSNTDFTTPKKFKEDEEKPVLEKKAPYHTGETNDPIPVIWYKNPANYKDIKIRAKSYGPTTGLKITVPANKKSVWKDIDGKELKVDPAKILNKNEKFRNKHPVTTRKTQEHVRDWLNYMGVRLSEQRLDVDHIQDLGFEGKDETTNLWPLGRFENQRAVGWRAGYGVRYVEIKGEEIVRRTAALGSLVGKHFSIKGFMDSPTSGVVPKEGVKPDPASGTSQKKLATEGSKKKGDAAAKKSGS